MNINSIESFWIVEAKEALQVADHLMEKGDVYYAGVQIKIIKEVYQWLQKQRT